MKSPERKREPGDIVAFKRRDNDVEYCWLDLGNNESARLLPSLGTVRHRDEGMEEIWVMREHGQVEIVMDL